MKYFRHLIAIAVAAACVCGARAGDVTREMAIAVADAWMAANPSFGASGSAISATAEYDGATLMWWTVATSGGGAIFVSPVTSIDPVLAAVPSCSGELPAAHPLRAILSLDVAKRRSVIAAATESSAQSSPARLMASASSTSSGTITNEAVAVLVAAAEGRWSKVVDARPRSRLAAAAPDGVTVLAEVPGFGDGANGYLRFWDQEEYSGLKGVRTIADIDPCFNLYTPNNAVCGCVATAGAALLQYFGATGLVANATRECTYNGATISLTTISATNHYDWSILPKEIGGQNPKTMAAMQSEAEQDSGEGEGGEGESGEGESGENEAATKFNAVKSLLGRATYDVGVCVKMGYTSGESGAMLKDLASALKEDFGFMTAKYIELGTNGDFSAVYEDLCRTNPVALGIRTSLPPFGGHAILAVGFGVDESTNAYTRLFMGWGGNYDAWYNLPDIQAGSHVFDIVDDAIVSISLDPPVKGAHRTVAEAKAAALENHRSILLVSGTAGDKAGTDLLIDYINGNSLTNDFEIYFADWNADPYADQNPSYGIFNPLEFNNNVDNRWAFYNGRLAYSSETNETAFAETFATGRDAWNAAYAEHLRLLAAAEDGVTVSTVNAVQYFNDDIVGNKIINWWYANPDADIEYEFWDGSLIYLTSEHESKIRGENLYVTDCSWEGELLENAYADGDTATLYAPAAVTNSEDGIALECAGWSLEAYGDDGWGEIDAGDGNAASFTVESNTIYRVTWFWDPSAMRLTTSATTGGSVSPAGTVWCPYGETVTVAATPNKGSYNWLFGGWIGDTDGCAATGSSLEVPMDVPRAIKAAFLKKSSGSSLTIVSDPATVKAEVTTGDGYLLAYGENQLSLGSVAIEVPDPWEDASGTVWYCTNWFVTGCCETNGTNPVAEFELTGDATLTWQWEARGGDDPPEPPVVEPAEAPIGPVEGGVTNSALVIYSTGDGKMSVETQVSNAKPGYWYSIWAADAVAGPYSLVSGTYTGTAKTLVEEPAPDVLSLVITFDPSEAAQFYKVVVTEEDPGE